MTAQLPPDPAAYDSPRAERARARGLAAPYIPGGRDPDPERTRREERVYVRLLVAMVAVLAFGALVAGILANLLGFGG
jgi:anti-sigma factor RsiW